MFLGDQVRVVIRGAASVKAVITGRLIASDRYLNLVLEDAVEVFSGKGDFEELRKRTRIQSVRREEKEAVIRSHEGDDFEAAFERAKIPRPTEKRDPLPATKDRIVCEAIQRINVGRRSTRPMPVITRTRSRLSERRMGQVLVLGKEVVSISHK